MKSKPALRKVLAGLCLSGLSVASYAADSAVTLPSVTAPYTHDSKSYMLALNESGSVNGQTATATATPKIEFEPATFTGSNAHKYLGLGTIVLAGLTMVTAPGEGCEGASCATAPVTPRETNGAHAKLGKATAAMAMAAVTTGLMAHWDDFHFEDGFSDPDNLHALLGTAGALAMTYAVVKSAQSTTPVSHAGMAEMGALAMVVAIKLTW